MAARTHPSRKSVVGLGAVAVATVLAAEGAVWLLRPRTGPVPPRAVREQDYFSAAELERASDFRGAQRLLGLATFAVEGSTLVTLALWRPPVLVRALRVTSRRPILGGAAVGAGIALTLAVAALPLGAVSQSRARGVGLSTQTFPAWLADQGRAGGVAAVLAALGGATAVPLSRRLGRRFWIGGSLLVVPGAVVFAWLAPILLAPIFNRFKPLPEGHTRSEALGLAERAGVNVGEVYHVDASRRSTALNAYVDGLGPTKRIVIYDSTLHDLGPGELNSVVAHELAHQKENDILRGLAFLTLAAPLGLLLVQLSAQALTRRTGDDIRTPAGLPALALSLAAAAVILGVPSGQLSRAVESRADAFALELTRDPAALIELQRRLAITNVGDPSPPKVLHFLLGTHPTTMERIGAALSYSAPPTPAAEAGGSL